MFRYNAYFGVHTVYYLDLLAQTGKSPLPMNRIIFAAVQTMLARTLGRKPGKQPVLNAWTRAFLDKLDNLKFLCYVGADGYPVLIPAIQTQSLDASTCCSPLPSIRTSWMPSRRASRWRSSAWR